MDSVQNQVSYPQEIYYHYTVAGKLTSSFFPIKATPKHYVTNCIDPFVCKELGMRCASDVLENSLAMQYDGLEGS